jgi:glycosyltransferase involved in cell wall biosynthesis
MSAPAPCVSVVIPLYNRAHTIERALSSVERQSFGDLEIIVVDDASQDGGAEKIAGRDPRIRILRHEANRGAAAARNTGIGAARGEYVAFLDSDDEWLPRKLATQIDLLGRCRRGADAVAAAFILLDDASGRYQTVRAPFRRDPRRSLLLGCTVSPGSTLVCRRDYFTGGRLFDERLRRLEDWDWLITYVQERELLLIDEPLAIIHGNAASHGVEALAALAAIEERHGQSIAALGPRAQRIFRATLLLERAAAAYRGRDYGRAAAMLGCSLMLYPFRGDFALRMLQRLLARRRQGPLP